jgi:riboflavin synthase
MFTGIIGDVGEVVAVSPRGAGVRARIACRYDVETIALGASIACAGPCLTVVETGRRDGVGTFDVEASSETLARTTLGKWRPGTRVNLERALKVGDELGGHIVTGHVDGVGKVVTVEPAGRSTRLVVAVPAELSRYIAAKGSVAVDGVSLTVNAVAGDEFEVNIIPHTQNVTVIGGYARGTAVNIEVDMLARYLERLVRSEPDTGIDLATLRKHGYAPDHR